MEMTPAISKLCFANTLGNKVHREMIIFKKKGGAEVKISYCITHYFAKSVTVSGDSHLSCVEKYFSSR